MIEDITMSSFFSEISLQQTLIALQSLGLGLWCLMPLSTIFVFHTTGSSQHNQFKGKKCIKIVCGGTQVSFQFFTVEVCMSTGF
jgi:hypothetical protein